MYITDRRRYYRYYYYCYHRRSVCATGGAVARCSVDIGAVSERRVVGDDKRRGLRRGPGEVRRRH